MTHEHAERFVAGPAMRGGATTVVPVTRVAAQALGAERGGLGAAAESELVGVWVSPDARPPLWLPARDLPPSPAASWSDWLLAHDDLLAAIRGALHAPGRRAAHRP